MQKQLFTPNAEQQLNVLTELREVAQKEAKPLIELWDNRRTLKDGIDTFFVPYALVSLKTSEKAVALMDKGYGVFNAIKTLQEEIVKPIEEENKLLKEENKKLIAEKNQLLALFMEMVIGDNIL